MFISVKTETTLAIIHLYEKQTKLLPNKINFLSSEACLLKFYSKGHG